jgi:hypothetical protein
VIALAVIFALIVLTMLWSFPGHGGGGLEIG